MRELSPFWFALGSFSIAPFWLLMVLAPRWRVTQRLLESPLVAIGPIALYAALVLPELRVVLPVVTHGTLPDVVRLLGTSRGATIAWAHFLALDLLAGRWIFLDARARGLPAAATSPILVLTLLLAPLGLAAYAVALALRAEPLRAATRALARAHRPLAWLTAGAFGLLAASLLLELVDGRQVLGVSTWVKPAKFAASIAVTSPVLAWIIAELGGETQRRLRRAGTLMAIAAALELVIITFQAARGVPSHFNNASVLDGVLFTVMGVGILGFWFAEVYVTVRAFRHRFASPARAWAIRLGLAGALLGGAIGGLMPIPTPAQRASLAAGEKPAFLGAHAVGVPDGGPGLPVTHWSTEGGDLRVPHFLGLHALQALPLLAWALERRRRAATRATLAVSVVWIGLILVTLAQALRGQPLLAPDGLTLASALAVLVGAGFVALAPVVSSAPRASSPLSQ
jgi:Domain of unknown function (DUF4281)